MKKYLLSAGFAFVSACAIAQAGKLVAEKSGKGAVITHEVQPKEGLYAISRIYGVKVAVIAEANGFDKNKGLSIGEKVKIPLNGENLSKKKTKTPVYYEASGNESLTSISNRFNDVPVKDLKSWNKIDGNAAPKDKAIIVGYFSGTAPVTGADVISTNAAAETPKSEKAASGKQGIIAGADVNIRKGPSTDDKIVGTGKQQETVDVLKNNNKGWVLIRTKAGIEGYIAEQFLERPVKEAEPVKKEVVKEAPAVKEVPVFTLVTLAKITGSNINIRKGPATGQAVAGIAQTDDEVEVIKQVNKEWSAIRTKNGVEGFVASRFLQPQAKEGFITGTNINVRKGPATDQQVLTQAQQGDKVSVTGKVGEEWLAIKAADGTEGFMASQFLTYEAPAPKEEPAPEVSMEEKEMEKKAEAIVAGKIADKKEAEAVAATPVIDESGFFKEEYQKAVNPNFTKDQTFSSGIFKTDRGWTDSKYYLLIDDLKPGTLVKISNPDNKKMVYAKVLGKMNGLQYSEGYDIRISEAAAKKLQLDNAEKFNVMVTF